VASNGPVSSNADLASLAATIVACAPTYDLLELVREAPGELRRLAADYLRLTTQPAVGKAIDVYAVRPGMQFTYRDKPYTAKRFAPVDGVKSLMAFSHTDNWMDHFSYIDPAYAPLLILTAMPPQETADVPSS